MSSFELIGKKEPLENIKTGIASGRLSHAVLLSGEKGVGKKFFSKHIIKMLVCQNKNKPCGICAQCQKIDKDIHPDVFNIFPAGKSETIGVKEIAPIKVNINIKPNDADFKFFIINEAERMNKYAQNAILKMIEEPPEDSIFILTSQNSQALLATVLSRVTKIALGPAEKEEIETFLKKNYSDFSNEEIKEAAKNSGGNIGTAISLLQNEQEREILKDSQTVALNIIEKDRALLNLSLGKYSKEKTLAQNLVNNVKQIYREAYFALAEKDSITEVALKISQRLSLKAILGIIDSCDRFSENLSRNVGLSLALTAFEIECANIIDNK